MGSHTKARQKWSDAAIAAMIRAHKAGASCTDIGRILGVSDHVVYKRMRAQGYSAGARRNRTRAAENAPTLLALKAFVNTGEGASPGGPETEIEPEVEAAPVDSGPRDLPEFGITAFTRPDGISLPYLRSLYGEMRA